MKSLYTFFCSSACALLSSVPLAAQGADAPLAESGKHTVTAIDIRGDALRMPPELRRETLSKPEAVHQLTNNLILRRALAAEAEAAGMANDPAIQAAMRIARERVLSDALIARIDAANKPKPEALEALALTNYKANPKRFDLPAEAAASHILIKKETANARAKAEAILAELKAGADFAKIAREKSEDGNAQDGGSLGYFTSGKMVPAFEAAVQKLQKPGDLSDIVETQFGYHVVKLDGRRPAGMRPFDQVKEALMREAEIKLLNERRMEHVQKVQQAVKINNPAIQEFAASVK
jgi:peptidyl-prolyl cis-trans isomerase C